MLLYLSVVVWCVGVASMMMMMMVVVVAEYSFCVDDDNDG